MKNFIKRHKGLLLILSAAVLTLLVMAVYIYDCNRVKKLPLSDFNTEGEYRYRAETVTSGRVFSYIEGYCYPANQLWEFYNYGFDSCGKGIYLNLGIGLVKGDAVYVLPAVQALRRDIYEKDRRVQVTREYNFYAGVKSKFISRFVPRGEYQVALIYTDTEGNKTLLYTESRYNR